MAIVLKGYGDATNCGCGCDGGCTSVTSNCNFVLRRFDYNSVSEISWLDNATEQDKECVVNGNCNGSGVDPCTGEGVIYGGGGGDGGGGIGESGCYVGNDSGMAVYTVPCCNDPATGCSGSLFYDSYYGGGQGLLYNGDITFNGVTYTILGGSITTTEEPSTTDEPSTPSENAPAMASNSNEATTFDYGGNVIGTFTVPYRDESIDFDNIGEMELTELEAAYKLCKFSYNFTFVPEDSVEYYIIALPCDSAKTYYPVSLEPDGRAYFTASYNKTSSTCSINQVTITSSAQEPPQ